MFIYNKKVVCIILFVFIISFFSPIYVLANEDAIFVWSDNNSSTAVETVASINQDKRKFFKFNMW